MSFATGQSVIYNSKYCTVFKLPGKRLFSSDSPGYLIKENKSSLSHDGILSLDLTGCSVIDICNDLWPDFIYTGDNSAASQWIINNLVTYLNNTNNIQWGNNSDNTEYSFIINGTTFIKNKTE